MEEEKSQDGEDDVDGLAGNGQEIMSNDSLEMDTFDIVPE